MELKFEDTIFVNRNKVTNEANFYIESRDDVFYMDFYKEKNNKRLAIENTKDKKILIDELYDYWVHFGVFIEKGKETKFISLLLKILKEKL